MIKSTIEAHPEKNTSKCLELVIYKLPKVDQDFGHNYKNSYSLPGQLVSACQGVEACSVKLVRPASNFEGVASDLLSAVGMWMRSHNNLPLTFNTLVCIKIPMNLTSPTSTVSILRIIAIEVLTVTEVVVSLEIISNEITAAPRDQRNFSCVISTYVGQHGTLQKSVKNDATSGILMFKT